MENNICFFFVPFSVNKANKVHIVEKFIDCLYTSSVCETEKIDTTLFYNYISKKVFSTEKTSKRFHVFSVNHNHQNVSQLYGHSISIVSPERFGIEKIEVYDFEIDEIKIVYSGDCVGFFVFQIHFITEKIDTVVLANSLYFLKKSTLTKCCNNKARNATFSFLDISLELINIITKYQPEYYDLNCFFHIDKNNARANYLLMANISENANDNECIRALYYLSNGFCDKYEYRDTNDNDETVYFAPNGRCWGISPESTVCLIRFRHKKAEEKMFLEFKKTYFILYTFILNQKYSYYYFLSKINMSKKMRTKEIKNYHDKLIDFEINNVFSVITEIPQYMGFYQRHLSVHDFVDLRADVNDPINRLNETRKNRAELYMAIIGIVLSVIGLTSVVVDIVQMCLT